MAKQNRNEGVQIVAEFEDLAIPVNASAALEWSDKERLEPSWRHADVFPIIARVIAHAYREQPQFIPAREIASRLLQDAEGRALVEAAYEQQQEKQSLEWLASNMVSWFSQRFTVGESNWRPAFERTKIDGLWAYKPIADGGQ